MWQALIGPIVNTVGGFLTQRQKNKATKQERKDELEGAKHSAQVDRIKRSDSAETNYDLLAMQQKRDTWMDEILILWTLTVVTLIFIPATSDTAIQGFKALEDTPLWFQLVISGCYISTLGIRFLFSGRGALTKVVK